MDDGDTKLQATLQKCGLLKQAVAQEKAEDIEHEKEGSVRNFQTLVDRLNETKSNLQKTAQQWQEYGLLEDNISGMLKTIEGKLKRENALAENLSGKEQQSSNIKASIRALCLYTAAQITSY